MIDLKLKNYIDWEITKVMPIKNSYGYRIILKYMDGSKKVQQKSGFKSKKEAEKVREITIAELHTGTYIVYDNISVSNLMDLWLEEDILKRVESASTYAAFSSNVKNHIKPAFGNKKVKMLDKGMIQQFYNEKAIQSVSVAKMCKTVLNLALSYAVSIKIINVNPAKGLKISRKIKTQSYHTRSISLQKTLNKEQIEMLLERSKGTKIYMMILLNVLMGLRRSEIIAIKYSDIDYINRTLHIHVQLGKKLNTQKSDFAPKTFTKQEVKLKTNSSDRTIPIPDIVFEAILRERKQYERNRSRRGAAFFDGDYICCSSYGNPRSKDYHYQYYKRLLEECDLPNVRWHDLRSSYCTLLLKNDFDPKAVSLLMGHAKEIITIDVYGDNKGIIEDAIPEIGEYIEDILPNGDGEELLKQELLDVVVDTTEFLTEECVVE